MTFGARMTMDMNTKGNNALSYVRNTGMNHLVCSKGFIEGGTADVSPLIRASKIEGPVAAHDIRAAPPLWAPRARDARVST